VRPPGPLSAGAGLLAAALLAAAPARAHGPAPVALEVLAHDGAAPTLLRTNLGLASANGDGSYAYVCPSRWDGNELAQATASPDGSEILVLSFGVVYLSRDGGCSFTPLTGEGRFVVSAARTAAGFVLVEEEYPTDPTPDRSTLLEVVDGEPRVVEADLPGPVDGVLATASGYLLSGATFVADEAGVRATFDVGASRVTPRAAEGDVAWLRATAGGEVWLLRVEGDALTESDRHVVAHGPVRLGDRWLAILDGVLHAYDAGEWVALGEVPWTCLRAREGHAFACSLEAMFELGPTGAVPEATPAFSMLQLGGPRACGDAAARRECERDWAHFGGESGWVETEPARSPTGERTAPTAEGCAAHPSAPASPWRAVAALAALALARRRR